MARRNQGAVVFALDGEGTIIHASDAAGRLVDDEDEPLEGAILWDRLPEPESARFQQACQQAIDTGQAIDVEVPWRREDRWFRLEVFPIGGNVSLHVHDASTEKHRQDELLLRERALREACEIVTDAEAGPRDRIKRLLSSIRGTLGTEFATLSYVDPEEGAYHFDAVGAANEDALPEGETIPLEELPICARVAQQEETIVLQDVEAEAPDLVDPTWGISAYIGSPARVGGQTYGTFCFYSTERRSEAFEDWEVTYVELFSDFASAELDRLAADAVTIDPPMLSEPPAR